MGARLLAAIKPLSGGLLTVALSLGLAACADQAPIFGSDAKVALSGTRVNALPPDRVLNPDPDSALVRLPAPEASADWPMPGGSSNHDMQQIQVASLPKPYWATRIGSGSGKRNALLGEPVIADGKVFAIDSKGVVTALKTFNGTIVWQTNLVPDTVSGESLLGGGVSYAKGRLFASTGFSEVSALDANSGKVLWRRSVTAPVRAGATIYGDIVYVTSVDNKGWALAADDGRVLWTTSGNESAATLLVAASPAADNGMVLLPYSSGQIAAVRAGDGSALWSDVIAGQRRSEATATISDIAGRPVLDGQRAFVIGYGGLLVCIDTRTGNRLWELETSGISQPWLAGDTLFVVTSDAKVLAVAASTGKVRWVTRLPYGSATLGDEANGGWAATVLYWMLSSGDTEHVRWLGPVLVSDRLVIVGSDGRMVTVSPYDGKFLGMFPLPFGVTVPPSVANGQIYVLMDTGELVAFQ